VDAMKKKRSHSFILEGLHRDSAEDDCWPGEIEEYSLHSSSFGTKRSCRCGNRGSPGKARGRSISGSTREKGKRGGRELPSSPLRKD